MKKNILILAAVALLLVAGPFIVIWALNTLFGLGIAYTIKTWAAALLLGTLIQGGGRR